jgi:hypothetical protein
MAKAVFGIASTYVQAESIVEALKAEGFASTDISVLFPDQQGSRDFAHENNTKAPEGAVVGAGSGGTVGGVLGWLALGRSQSLGWAHLSPQDLLWRL